MARNETYADAVSTALILLDKMQKEDPALHARLRHAVPALARNMAKAGQPVDLDTLEHWVSRFYDPETGRLKDIFGQKTGPQRTYSSVYKDITGKSPDNETRERLELHDGHSKALRYYFQRNNISRDDIFGMFTHAAITEGCLPMVSYLLENWDAIARQWKWSAEDSVLLHERLTTEVINQAYFPAFELLDIAASTCELPEDTATDYIRFLSIRNKHPEWSPDMAYGLVQANIETGPARDKNFASIYNLLNFEDVSAKTKAVNAAFALRFFANDQEVLGYMEASTAYLRRTSRTRNLAHHLINEIPNLPECPESDDVNTRRWGQQFRRWGQKLCFYYNFAPMLPDPVCVRENSRQRLMNFREIRDTLRPLAYARRAENSAMADLCYRYRVEEDAFDRILDVQAIIGVSTIPAPRPDVSVPDFEIDGTVIGEADLTIRVLPHDDPRIYILGAITGCCEQVAHPFELTIFHALSTRESAFVVAEDSEGNILAHSWMWRAARPHEYFDDTRDMVRDGWESLSPRITKELVDKIDTAIAVELHDDKYAGHLISRLISGESKDALHNFTGEKDPSHLPEGRKRAAYIPVKSLTRLQGLWALLTADPEQNFFEVHKGGLGSRNTRQYKICDYT